MSFCSWLESEHFRDHFEKGVYTCSVCKTELFKSKSKFEHTSPWPAFSSLIENDRVTRIPESEKTIRIACAKCGSGLGHEFLGKGPNGLSRF